MEAYIYPLYGITMATKLKVGFKWVLMCGYSKQGKADISQCLQYGRAGQGRAGQGMV